MKIKFLKIILIAFVSVLPFFASAQAGPTVTFNGEPTATLGSVSGCNAFITLAGRIIVQGVSSTNATVAVAYSENALNTSYDGSFNEIYDEFGDTSNFSDSVSGFIPGHTYYFLFRTGLNPAPAGFVPDFATAMVSIPPPPGGPCPNGTETGDPGDGTETGDPGDGTETGDPGDGTEVGDGSLTFLPTSTIHNPLGEDVDILGFIGELFENFVKIALPILVLFTIWSGLQFVMARGNEEKLTDAKRNFLYVIIGAAVVFGAWGLANILAGTVEQFEAFNHVLRLLV